MSNLAIGTGFLSIIGIVIAFVIAAFLLRWIFRINKIVDLLMVIAQELRATNTVNEIDSKLTEKGLYKDPATAKIIKLRAAPGQIRPPLK